MTTPDTAPLLAVRDLRVSYRTRGREVPALRGVDLQLSRGEVVALVGESGSGKSTLAHSIIGLLAPNASIGSGQVLWRGTDLAQASTRTYRRLRGREIGLVPQDPTVSLNPVQRVGAQVAEVLKVHGLADRRGAAAAAVAALEKAGLPDPELRAQQYPHELSGGMRQRVLIAIAIAADPQLLIADEPTSALDVTVQRRILDHLDGLRTERELAVLLVTHDLGVAADRAQRIVVMSEGRIVEDGAADAVLHDPRHEYTQRLLRAAPGLALGGDRNRSRVDRPPAVRALASAEQPALVRAANLVKEFRLPQGATVRAVDDVSFAIPTGQTLALVGESGSGKSTTARLVLGLTPPTSGTVTVGGAEMSGLRGSAWREARRHAQLVYQNPFASLDPRWRAEDIVGEPLRVFKVGTRAARHRRVAALIDRVALPASTLDRKAAELSGGQRQRLAIARALALSPQLVVLDEPVSALDVSVQAQVLELLAELQCDQQLTYLFITHDLAVVGQIAHQAAVMRAGSIVESGPVDQLFTRPRHDYTRDLLDSIAGRHLSHAPAARA
ncbi:dipeptide ABC transporter ATP-binding protein [Cumulibacter manganitolerans]|uniref:dipeptide ABC transporter ATP-binding protein n=1 Tax=Cumulibacter manganitolerans TaxID=1884992 RepID=UPI001E445935|nr:ABC transporter ATP-binding protein [Cumulibacter manganitolerans]